MMASKFGLILFYLCYFFVITTCVVITEDGGEIAETNTVQINTQSQSLPKLPTRPKLYKPSSVPSSSKVALYKPTYTLAESFAEDLRTLVHKIAQTFLKISQKQQGQQTLQHIHQELYTIMTNEVTAETLKFVMAKLMDVLQDSNATLVLVTFAETIQELIEQENLADWAFVIPWAYEINQNPNLILIIDALVAEVAYIQEKDERIEAATALIRGLQNKLAALPPTPTTTMALPTTKVEDVQNNDQLMITSTTQTLPIQPSKQSQLQKLGARFFGTAAPSA